MQSGRLETLSFYALLVTIILVPLAFIPSPYVGLDLVKTIVIAIGTLVAATSLSLGIHKERKITLPPKALSIVSGLLMLSLIISAFLSANVARSFFGQGLETGTASFVLLLFVAMGLSYALVRRHVERAGLIYLAFVGTFLILAVFHILRFFIGTNFAQLPFFGGLASTFFGTWSSLGVYSLLVSIISLAAILFLPLSKTMKIVYWVAASIGLFAGLITHVPWVLGMYTLVLIGFSVYMYTSRKATHLTWSKRISWIPTIVAVIFLIATFWSGTIVNRVVTSIGADYTELTLPWQLTLDVTSSSLKSAPLFGVGPNFFGQAFLTYKPLIINNTDLWGVEFGNGVGTLPTYLVNQGLVGGILWLLFLIFVGIMGWRTLRHISDNPYTKFLLVSSFFGSAFSWLVLLGYNPSHAFLYSTFVITGIWLGAAVSFGALKPFNIHPPVEARTHKILPIVGWICVALFIVWGLVYVKKTVAFGYFASGVKHLTQEGDLALADKNFLAAAKIDPSDIFWQARVEAGLALVTRLSNVAASSPQASSTEIGTAIATTLNQSLAFATQAIAINPQNYYNYLSAARVSEVAMRFQVPSAYESAIKAYTEAIRINPYNPSLYLNVARVEATQGKYDNAIQAIGAAIQVKSNYSDAAFMASQIAASQGKIADAITAARATTQLSPGSPVAWFQLGILQYTNKEYAESATSLGKAVQIQPEYANASYFLGLAYARQGKMADATKEFEKLVKSNPDNQEVALILGNLRAGRSPFTDAEPPVTTTPETRPTLPLKDPEPKAKSASTATTTSTGTSR